MHRWEYAVGHQRLDDTWTNDTDPATFEVARRDLIIQQIQHGDEDWAHDLRVIKRGDHQLDWTPVYDHAAELLVEVLEGVRLDFATIGSGIVQGSDVARIFKKRAQVLRNTLPNQNQEYDS
ncbi:hypothetical protein HOU95_gp095 [Streptomyces phage Hiyaa]|uniref:Uncharacterized protein n=1 Tax=Streptomyces phage Hiyaa TaxID=2499072 RepID=A0A3S9U8R3_9CAUD|nr:hypothetical protein HOU95_gp095 [Streptomyces phage Hiyaa]AZS06712.1 hypothetical protein SEA_HIYAA_73 [Streptomyces phage Hiyaa]